MNKSTKVRAIFAELVQVYGADIPEHELLDSASQLADAFDDTLTSGGVYFTDGRTPICELPVNEVIGIMDWQLLEFDYKCNGYRDDLYQDSYKVNVSDEIRLNQILMAA